MKLINLFKSYVFSQKHLCNFVSLISTLYEEKLVRITGTLPLQSESVTPPPRNNDFKDKPDIEGKFYK